jgi:hypothetical protein
MEEPVARKQQRFDCNTVQCCYVLEVWFAIHKGHLKLILKRAGCVTTSIAAPQHNNTLAVERVPVVLELKTVCMRCVGVWSAKFVMVSRRFANARQTGRTVVPEALESAFAAIMEPPAAATVADPPSHRETPFCHTREQALLKNMFGKSKSKRGEQW